MPDTSGSESIDRDTLMSEVEQILPDTKVSKPPVDAYPINAATLLSAEEWQFVPQDEHEVMAKMEKEATEFNEYEGSFANNGVQTGSNDIFVIDEDIIQQYGIEEDAVYPTLGGRDVSRWYTSPVDKYILYMTPETDLDELPGAKQYLEDKREGLENRYCVEDNRREWYQLAEHRPGVFNQSKVVTPDICYYNNFFHDQGGEFYSLNSTYILSSEELAEDYLVGILNSDAVQFYMRRTAPQYGNDYLRYVTSYLEEIPVPDPENAEEKLVEIVKERAASLKRLTKEFQEASDLLDNPETAFDREDIERSSLSFAGYIESIPFDGTEDAEVTPNTDGSIVHLNVQDRLEFVDEKGAEMFAELLRVFGLETTKQVEEMDVPNSIDELRTLTKLYRNAEQNLEEHPNKAEKLEQQLNEAVYELYGFEDEHRELIRQRVDKPETPLEAKVRS